MDTTNRRDQNRHWTQLLRESQGLSYAFFGSFVGLNVLILSDESSLTRQIHLVEAEPEFILVQYE